MIITTSQNIEGETVSEYCGIVSAAAIMMIMAGGNKVAQFAWRTGVEDITEMLKKHAAELGADAVIAARYEYSGTNICAIGTAVKFAE